MGDPCFATTIMREPAWRALACLCRHFEVGETPEFDIGLAYASAYDADYGSMPWLTTPASMAGVEWDTTHDAGQECSAGFAQCRGHSDGSLTIKHVCSSDEQLSAEHLYALLQSYDVDALVDKVTTTYRATQHLRSLDADILPPAERALVRRAQYAKEIAERVQSALGLDMFERKDLDHSDAGLRLYFRLCNTEIGGMEPDDPVAWARRLLLDELPDVLPTEAVFNAAPLALLALAGADQLPLEVRARQAQVIVAQAERCGGFVAPDDPRFNVLERFLALLGRSNGPFETLPALEPNNARDVIEQRIMGAWRPLVDACVRCAPDYIACACVPSLFGVTPDAPPVPWNGILLDLGLLQLPMRRGLKNNMLIHVAESVAEMAPLQAGALQTQWLFRSCWTMGGLPNTYDMLSKLSTAVPLVRARVMQSLSTSPRAAQGLWQYASHFASEGGFLAAAHFVGALEITASYLPVMSSDETARMLDTIREAGRHQDDNAQKPGAQKQTAPLIEKANTCVARLCCAALPKMTLLPEHASKIDALAALFGGGSADEAEALARMSDARLRSCLDASHAEAGAFVDAAGSISAPGL